MLYNAFILALREIRRNVLRSFLTVLGIVIGVASVIAMVIAGDGTTAYVTQSISKLGSNLLIIHPGQERRGPHSRSLNAPPFDIGDVQAIEQHVGGIRAISAIASGTLTVVHANESRSTTVYGTDNAFFAVKEWGFSDGRSFLPNELAAGRSVCIIGETVRKELFDNQEPIGASLRLEKFSCQIVGALEPKGAASFGRDQDDLIIVPLKMFQRRISGNRDIPSIQISALEGATESVKEEIDMLLRERRRIREGKPSDFHVRDLKDVIATLSSTTEMLTLLLGAVAAISLLVGGIGIMNIMLVSVTERTREIGIRLAIGALEREVLLQFLVEAVVLSALGGMIGIVLGLGIGVGVSYAFTIPFVFNKAIILIAFLFSVAVGIIFGYFPARKAARLNPIDALRHE